MKKIILIVISISSMLLAADVMLSINNIVDDAFLLTTILGPISIWQARQRTQLTLRQRRKTGTSPDSKFCPLKWSTHTVTIAVPS